MVSKKVLKKNSTINVSNIKLVKKTLIKKKKDKVTANAGNGIKVKKIKKLKKSNNNDLQNKMIVEKSSVKSLKKSKLKKSKERKLKKKKTGDNAAVPPALVPTVTKKKSSAAVVPPALVSTVTKKKSSGLSYNKVDYESSETGSQRDSADDGRARMVVMDPEEKMEVTIPRDTCAVHPSDSTDPKKTEEPVDTASSKPLKKTTTKGSGKSKRRYFEEAFSVQRKKKRAYGQDQMAWLEWKQRQKERKKQMEELIHRERELENDVFGISSEILKDDGEEDDYATSSFSKEGVSNYAVKDEGYIPEDPFDIHNLEEASKPQKKPAWVDEDDENIRVKDVKATLAKPQGTKVIRETSEKKHQLKKYEVELREKFSNTVGTPEWADLSRKPTVDSDDDDLVRKTGNYLSEKSSTSLAKKSLEYERMFDLNSAHTEGAIIRSIEFNPYHQVAMVGGEKNHLGVVTLYQVDGKANHRIHSVRFPGFPVTSTQFLRDGKQFAVGSESNNYFFIYDMETSKELKTFVGKKFERGVKNNLHATPDGKLLVYLGSRGQIYIYDTTSLSLVDTMEAPCNLTAATFSSDSSRMYTHGLTGDVYIWDMTSRVCLHKFYDDGCIVGESIAVSPNNQYVACGSRSGIVNIYDYSSLSSASPAPIQILSNLTTAVTALTFNPSSEILAMASSHTVNGVKLVHFPSMTIFENFPAPGRAMKKAQALQFSPNSGYFAVGDIAGAVPLFRLNHYSSY